MIVEIADKRKTSTSRDYSRKRKRPATVIVLYLLIVFADLWPLSFFGETVHDS